MQESRTPPERTESTPKRQKTQQHPNTFENAGFENGVLEHIVDDLQKQREHGTVDLFQRLVGACETELKRQPLGDYKGHHLHLKSDFDAVRDNNLYLFIRQEHGKTSLFYTTKIANGRIVEEELTNQDIDPWVLLRIFKAVKGESLEFISKEDKREILKITSNKGHTHYKDAARILAEARTLAGQMAKKKAFIGDFLQRLASMPFSAERIIFASPLVLDEDSCRGLSGLLVRTSCVYLTLDTTITSPDHFELLVPWISNGERYKNFIHQIEYSQNSGLAEARNNFVNRVKQHNTQLLIGHFKQSPKKQSWPKVDMGQFDEKALETLILTEAAIEVNFEHANNNTLQRIVVSDKKHIFLERLYRWSRNIHALRTEKSASLFKGPHLLKRGDVRPRMYKLRGQGPYYEETSEPEMGFTDEQVPHIIAALLQNKGIVSLDLSKSPFTTGGLRQLWAALPGLPELSRLDFSENNLCDEDIVTLCQVIKNTKINELYLQHNRFTNQGVIAIANLLQAHRYLCRLDLSANSNDNPISNVALTKLAETLKPNKTLVYLAIVGWNVDETHIGSFLKSLKQNTALIELNVYLPEVYEKESYDQLHQIRRENSEKKKREDFRNGTINNALKKNRERQAKMCLAASEGDVRSLQTCLQQGSSLYTYDPQIRKYAFHTAVKANKPEIVRVFCQKGINTSLPVFMTDGSGPQCITALELFPHEQHQDLLALLNAPPQAIVPAEREKKQAGIGSFFKAAQPVLAADAPMIQPIVWEPAELVVSNHLRNHYLVSIGQLTIEALTAADIQYTYPDGKTVLHIAVEHRQLNMVQRSLAKGAVIDTVDRWGRTALYYACMPPYHEDNVAIVETLLIAGAQIHLLDKTNRSIVCHMASIHNTTLDASSSIFFNAIAKMLAQRIQAAEAPVYDPISDIANCTALHLSIIQGHYKFAQYLLKTECYQIKTPTGAGDTCLLLAVKAGRPDILQLLLIKDLSLDHTDLHLANNKGETALAVANALAEQESATEYQKKCYKILQDFQSQQRPGTALGAIWTRNFRFCYGNKTIERPYLVDLNSVHDTLSNNLKNPGGKKGNAVTVAMTLIISQGAYASGNTQKHHITVFLDKVNNSDFINQLKKLDENFVTIGDRRRNRQNLAAIQRRLRALPAGFPLSTDAREINPSLALSAEAAEELFNMNALDKSHSNYEQHFSHSEQHLFKLLDNSENVKTLMKEWMKEWQQDPRFEPGCKVFAVILSIHSLRYVCGDCTAAIIGEQNLYDCSFLKLLTDELTKCEFRMPTTPLRMLTTVSSEIPHATNKKRLEDHQELIIDLRCNYGKRAFFERDAESTAVNMANISSGVF